MYFFSSSSAQPQQQRQQQAATELRVSYSMRVSRCIALQDRHRGRGVAVHLHSQSCKQLWHIRKCTLLECAASPPDRTRPGAINRAMHRWAEEDKAEVGRQLHTVTGQHFEDEELQAVVDSGEAHSIYQRALMAPGQSHQVCLCNVQAQQAQTCTAPSAHKHGAWRPLHADGLGPLCVTAHLPSPGQSQVRLTLAAKRGAVDPTCAWRERRPALHTMLMLYLSPEVRSSASLCTNDC